MAKTRRAANIAELQKNFLQPATTFEQKVLCLRSLLSVRHLGRPTRRWIQKQIFALQSEVLLSDPAEQPKRQELFEGLLERNDIAIKKSETRAANKAAKHKSSKTAAQPATKGDSWLDQIKI